MRKDIMKQLQKHIKKEIRLNKSELARRLDCDVRTITKYLQTSTEIERKPRQLESKIHKFEEVIIEKTDLYGATAISIYNFLKEKGYNGSYSLVKQFVKRHKKEEQKKAIMRFETEPGLQAQVDWKEKKKMINRFNEIFEFNIFLVILGFSRGKYLEITEDKTQPTLFKCLIKSFQSFGGVPHELLFDNMKTVVDSHNTFINKVNFNTKFEQFSKDLNFRPLACQPYRPQTKGKVEALAKLTNRLDAYNGEFETFEELQDIAKKVMIELNDEISQATMQSPNSLLKKEKQYFSPLASEKVISQYINPLNNYKVGKDSMISYKGRRYSVNVDLIDKTVNVFNSKDNELEIYYDSQLICKHKISDKIFNIEKEHMIQIIRSNYNDILSEEEIVAKAEKALINFDLC